MLSLSQLWQAKEKCKTVALKPLGTSALKDRKVKWLYKMSLQLQLVTGLSWAGKHVMALVQLNHNDSRFMERSVIWMGLYSQVLVASVTILWTEKTSQHIKLVRCCNKRF